MELKGVFHKKKQYRGHVYKDSPARERLYNTARKGLLIRTGQKPFFANVDGPEQHERQFFDVFQDGTEILTLGLGLGSRWQIFATYVNMCCIFQVILYSTEQDEHTTQELIKCERVEICDAFNIRYPQSDPTVVCFP